MGEGTLVKKTPGGPLLLVRRFVGPSSDSSDSSDSFFIDKGRKKGYSNDTFWGKGNLAMVLWLPAALDATSYQPDRRSDPSSLQDGFFMWSSSQDSWKITLMR